MVFSGTSPDGRLVEMVEIQRMTSISHVNSILNSYQDLTDLNLFSNRLQKRLINIKINNIINQPLRTEMVT